MGDILKMIRFDFISVLTTGGGKSNALVMIVLVLLFAALPLFISPFLSFYVITAAGALIVPLQSAKKDDLGRLYGTLPVKYRNVIRARFIYIVLLHFAAELIALLTALIAVTLKLNRLLPQESDFIRENAEYFDISKLPEFAPIFCGFALFFCLMFSFMEMMGQIFGRENEMKILLIALGALVAAVLGFSALTDAGIIPYMDLSSFPKIGGTVLVVILHIVIIALSAVFGEITAARLSKREL